MIKGVLFSKYPKDFLKPALTLINNHVHKGSTFVNIISLLHVFFILSNTVTVLIRLSKSSFCILQMDFEENIMQPCEFEYIKIQHALLETKHF